MSYCQAVTKSGTQCTNKAKEYGCCGIKAHRKQIIDKTPVNKRKKLKIPTAVTAKRLALEKNYRGIDPELSYTNLGWIRKEGNKYYHEEIGVRDYGERDRLYPDNFLAVAKNLKELCMNAGIGGCDIHPTYPGVQWNNDRSNYEANEEEFNNFMFSKGNHYFHNIRDNPIEIFGANDIGYCMCEEWRKSTSAFETLTFKDNEQGKWNEKHGICFIDDDDVKRNVDQDLKNKIRQNSIDFLGEEYKIHLQPKPEYQVAVIQELINLIRDNDEVRSCITAWKTLISYSSIKEINVAAVVIYPVWGEKCTRTVLNNIIEHFSKFNAAEIGLNITPRFNYKYNELIYWANGSGDHKLSLPEKYFTSPEKIFYIGHELYY